MAPIRVGILRGGQGHEYEVSLKTGAGVLKNLPSDKYQPVDILLTRDGTWHLSGLPVEPARAIQAVDVVFNALHGEYGEDGQIQQFPYDTVNVFDRYFFSINASRILVNAKLFGVVAGVSLIVNWFILLYAVFPAISFATTHQ
jgi:hypothetical protein